MSKNKKNSTKELIISIVVISIIGIIIWPLFDLIYSAIFTNSEFHYSVVDYVVEPIILGTIISVTLWVIGKKQNK